MDIPRVSVIIPVLNVESTIETCLSSLMSQTHPHGATEIIVIDGYSSDRTVGIVKTFPVRLIQTKGNATTAINCGARLATGEVLLFADGDAFYPKDWIDSHLKCLAKEGTVASGGPCVTWQSGGLFAELVGFELTSRYLALPDAVPRISTMNLALRREVFEQIGGMNEQFDVAYDAELGYRLRSKGYSIRVTRQALAYHSHRSNLPGYFSQQYRYALFVPRLFKEHPRAMGGDQVTSLWMNTQPLLFALFILTSLLALTNNMLFFMSAVLAMVLLVGILGDMVSISLRTRRATAVLVIVPLVVRLYAWTFGGLSFTLGLVSRLRAVRGQRAQ